MRLVDADALKESMKQAWISTRFIDAAPTIDAVPVVRCKDCKHRHESEFCERRPEDAFCSDGERRTDNGT